jgi:tRNA nucleotidyltransferase/poly(A) polymerase
MMLDELRRLFPKLPPTGYVVGGAVRDLLLGVAPLDADVASIDPLRDARSLGRKVIRLGSGEHLSAYRVVDGPHVYDFAAILDGDIAADLARRDFTIDAMAVDLESGSLLDPHGGRRDLGLRVIRMVDPANFDDDPLRMLKAVRMAVRLGFSIDEATRAAIAERASRVTTPAAERVAYELGVIFSADAFARAVAGLRETRLDVPLFGRELPQFDVDEVPLVAAYALLVSDPRAFGKRWRWSETLTRDVLTLQKLAGNHDRLALYDAGEDLSRQLPAMLRALGRDEVLDFPDFSLRPLLTGEEIAEIAGIPPGPALGRVKRAMLEEQVAGRIRTREEAAAFVASSGRSF